MSNLRKLFRQTTNYSKQQTCFVRWYCLQKKQKEKAMAALENLSKKPAVPAAKPVIKSVAKPAEASPEAADNEAELNETPGEKPDKITDEVTDEIIEIAQAIMEQSKSSHEFYIGMVKRFGQKKGREFYSRFKSDYQVILRNNKAKAAE